MINENRGHQFERARSGMGEGLREEREEREERGRGRGKRERGEGEKEGAGRECATREVTVEVHGAFCPFKGRHVDAHTNWTANSS